MKKSRRTIWVLPFLIAVALFSAGVWAMAYRSALDQLAERGRTDLALASDRLVAQLFRYRELAVVLSDHPDLVAVLDGSGTRAGAEAVLREMADKTGAGVLELVDRSGRVVAASQDLRAARDPKARLLARALNGAIGVANGVRLDDLGQDKRLFAFAAPVFGAGGPSKGAVVSEVDTWLFEQNWPTTATAVWFVDSAGRIVVTNRSELILMQRWTDEDFLNYQPYSWAGHKLWSLEGGRYLPDSALHLEKELPVVGLSAEILLSTGPAEYNAALQAAIAAALCLVFGALLFLATERRRALAVRLEVEASANAKLEARVAKRTRALSEANLDLRREVSERKEAEAAMKKAQDDLVQAGKLSALGQMSAGISHELNQPLMAIGSFAENGTQFLERDKPEQAAQNLSRISELARRMGRIIKNLRAFARQESEPISDVDLVQVVDAAAEMVAGKMATHRVMLNWQAPDMPVMVRGGEVRLQQVVVNLISNAADAMVDSNTRRVDISLDHTGGRVRLSVRDTGPGIDEPERIFDPFYSTKEVGDSEGVGLGLSISYGLVQSFGGDIHGQNLAEGGAVFTVELDAAGLEAAA